MSSLAGIPPLPGMKGRGLGGLAPLGRPSAGLGGGGLDSLSSLGSLGSLAGTGGLGATAGFLKPKLGSSGTNSGGNSPRGNALGALTSTLGAPRHPSSSSSSSHLYSSSSTSPSSTSPSAPSSSAPAPIRPLRLALRYQPPTLALEYSDLRHPLRRNSRLKTFPLTLNTASTASHQQQAEGIARELARAFPHYLSEHLVSQAQLVRLVRKALARGSGSGDVTSSSASRLGPLPSVSGSGRMGSLPSSSSSSHPHSSTVSASASIDESLSHSALEESIGEESHAGADQHGEEHDVDVEASHEEEEQQQDESAVEHDQSDDDIDGLYHPPPPDPTLGEDLNRVSEATLAKKKADMDKLFQANALRPDDPDYVYDKQVDFEPTEESEWD